MVAGDTGGSFGSSGVLVLTASLDAFYRLAHVTFNVIFGAAAAPLVTTSLAIVAASGALIVVSVTFSATATIPLGISSLAVAPNPVSFIIALSSRAIAPASTATTARSITALVSATTLFAITSSLILAASFAFAAAPIAVTTAFVTSAVIVATPFAVISATITSVTITAGTVSLTAATVSVAVAASANAATSITIAATVITSTIVGVDSASLTIASPSLAIAVPRRPAAPAFLCRTAVPAVSTRLACGLSAVGPAVGVVAASPPSSCGRSAASSGQGLRLRGSGEEDGPGGEEVSCVLWNARSFQVGLLSGHGGDADAVEARAMAHRKLRWLREHVLVTEPDVLVLLEVSGVRKAFTFIRSVLSGAGMDSRVMAGEGGSGRACEGVSQANGVLVAWRRRTTRFRSWSRLAERVVAVELYWEGDRRVRTVVAMHGLHSERFEEQLVAARGALAAAPRGLLLADANRLPCKCWRLGGRGVVDDDWRAFCGFSCVCCSRSSDGVVPAIGRLVGAELQDAWRGPALGGCDLRKPTDFSQITVVHGFRRAGPSSVCG